MLKIQYNKSQKELWFSDQEGLRAFFPDKEVEFIYKGAKIRLSLFAEIEREFSIEIDICHLKEIKEDLYGLTVVFQDHDCSRCRIEVKSFIRIGEYIKFDNMKIELVNAYKVEKCI
jgi:hypothetical protein